MSRIAQEEAVAEQQQQIDAAFAHISEQIFRFHKNLITSGGTPRDDVPPNEKMTLHNKWNKLGEGPRIAFYITLKQWAAEKLVPEYRASLDTTIGNDDTISRNFICFSLVAELVASVFHGINAPCRGGLKVDAPDQVLFNAYREQCIDEFRPQIQQLFFRRVAELRKTDDQTKIGKLLPIAIAFYEAPAGCDDSKETKDKSDAYHRDCIDSYVERMVIDNKTAIEEKIKNGIPVNLIAEWINRRANFEQALLNTFFARERKLNIVHADIMRKYDIQVVAKFAKDLIADEKHGFAASFRNGDETVESFSAAIVLFHISARIEKSHKDCVEECVREFRKAIADRLKPILTEVQGPVYDTPVEHARAFVSALMPKLRTLEKIIERMKNRTDLVACVKIVLNPSDGIVRKVKRGTGNDEKKIPFAEVLAVFVECVASDETAALSVDAATETVNDIGALFHFVQDKHIVVNCINDLINDEKQGFAASFRNGDKTVESFSAAIVLFRLAARIEKSHKNCVEECVREFRKAVTDRLKRLLGEVQGPVYETPVEHAKAFVNALLTELRTLDKTIERMNKHTDLQRANVDCFKAVLNSPDDCLAIVRKVKRGTGSDEKKIPFAEVLAVFVDTFLKSDEGAAASVDAATETVNDIGALFHFVQDKDIFGEHYKLRLSKRLLLTKYNEDTELQILEKMQKQSGKHFIHKFEGMINDLRVANAIQQTIDDANVAMPAVFGIKILTFAYWPQIKPDETFVFPDSLQQCQDTFTRHYRVKNPTRLLKWQAERGSAIVDINYPKGPKEVAMNMHQAAVIIAIDADSARPDGVRPLSVLSTVTGIEVSEIKPLVASMLLAKGLQLVRVKGSGLNPKFTESDVIEMNPDYTIKMRKIKLPTAATARTAASETVKEETIDAFREQVLDAEIVKIMKSRKEMKQQDLVESTIQAVLKFFHPQPRHIKLRIEQLMAKEFLERDENETDVYRYLA